MTFQKGDLVQAKPSTISLPWEGVYLVAGPAVDAGAHRDGGWIEVVRVDTGETSDIPASLFNLIARAKK